VQIPKPSFWDSDLYIPLEKAFLKACRRRVRVRFMKIWFRDFSTPSAQLSLFAFAPPEEQKKAQAIRALDRIREKHGETLIQYGRTTNLTRSNDQIQMTHQNPRSNYQNNLWKVLPLNS
jgi:hypothetical protein